MIMIWRNDFYFWVKFQLLIHIPFIISLRHIDLSGKKQQERD